MNKTPCSHVESEITLVICSERPAEIADSISGVTRAGDCGLIPDDDRRIYDVYFDTPQGILGRALWSLRVRTVGAEGVPVSPDRVPREDDESRSDRFITLKGPAVAAGHGGVDRIELEVSWSPHGLAACLEELGGLGIILPAGDFRADAPTRTLRSMGLVVIQERSTQRRIRLARVSHEGPVQAELSIDRVSYLFGTARVVHREIEIETRAPQAEGVVKSLALELARMFGTELRPWRPGKLVTGIAVARLLDAGRLEGLMNEEQGLLAGAYDLIEECLRGLPANPIGRNR